MRCENVSVILGTLMLLTGCGGGGGGGDDGGEVPPPPPPPAVLTGTVAGPVVGMSFSTPTRSGVTNATGQFTYLAGETVTFRIGGVQVGSAPGAAAMGLFHLYGATPPMTEAALRAELTTRYNVTGFDRVANLALLLASLDADGNAANGFEVSAWNTPLSGATLNLNLPIYAFKPRAFDRFARVHGVPRNVSQSRALAQVYQTMGVAVPVQARSSESQDRDNNGSFDLRTEYEYDAQGQRTATRFDADLDGVVNAVERFTYDAAGRVLTEVTDYDSNDDGAVDYRQTQTLAYDARGNVTSQVNERDTAIDGTVDQRDVYTYTYDAAGNRTQRLRELDSDGNGTTNFRVVVDYTYNSVGDELSRTEQQDANGDGVFNNRTSQVSSYDANGNKTADIIEFDTDGNGVLNRRAQWHYTFEAAGNELTSLYEEDENVDGVLEVLRSTTNMWNASGQFLSSRVQSSSGGTDYEFLRSLTYNDNGDVLTDREEGVAPAYLFLQIDSATYDAAGNRTSESVDLDMNTDGSLDYVSKRDNTFNANNALTLRTYRDEEGSDIEAWRRGFAYEITLANGVAYLVDFYVQEDQDR